MKKALFAKALFALIFTVTCFGATGGTNFNDPQVLAGVKKAIQNYPSQFDPTPWINDNMDFFQALNIDDPELFFYSVTNTILREYLTPHDKTVLQMLLNAQ